MSRMTESQRAQVEEVLGMLFEGERTSIVVSHLVDVADPVMLGGFLVSRGKDLLDAGDDDELAQRVIRTGELLQRS